MEKLVEGLLSNAQPLAALADLTLKALANCPMLGGSGHRPMYEDVGIDAQDPTPRQALASAHRSSISS